MIDRKQEHTLLKIADYNNNEKMIFSKRLHYLLLVLLLL